MQRISITNPQNIIDGTAKKYYFRLRNTGGPKGDKGDTGATGPQGAQGETGPRGPQGERGTNATVYVGTTSTLAPGSQATVYNSGSDSSAILNFGIPQGAKGDTGSQGPQGEPGTPGQNFTATVVTELPETGDSSKLYLTPKAHTTQTATGNPITASVAEQAGKLESFQLDGDTLQNGTPTPEEPVPIQTVTGLQTVSIIGKNLFNKNAVTNGGYIDTNGEVVAWETFGYSEYIRVIGGQTYSYSGTANNVGYSAKAAWYDSNKNFISAFSFGASGQVTAPATAKFLRTSVRIASPSGLDTYQLELGSTITTYEDYRATNYPINLGSIELCKLDTYQDYIYKDSDDWKIHKATATKTFNGADSEDWAINNSGTPNFWYRARSAAPGTYGSPDNSRYLYCNYESGAQVTTSNTTQGVFVLSGGDVRLRYGTEMSLDNWKAKLATTNMILTYALETATDTVITDATLIAQLEAIRNAQLATGANTITNNATAPNLAGDMEIGYYEYDPTNRYDKWLWLRANNAYEEFDEEGGGGGGGSITVDSALSTTSKNPVQNKVVTAAINSKVDSSSLATVATSGSYNDLSNKPTIPTVNNGTLTIQQNGTTVGTFTANQSGNTTVNLAGGIYADDPTTPANPNGWITPSDIDWSAFTDGSTYFTIGSLLIQFGTEDFGNQSYSSGFWGSTNRSANQNLRVTFPKAFSAKPYYVGIQPVGSAQMAIAYAAGSTDDSATKSRDFAVLVPSSQTGTLSTKVQWIAIGPA